MEYIFKRPHVKPSDVQRQLVCVVPQPPSGGWAEEMFLASRNANDNSLRGKEEASKGNRDRFLTSGAGMGELVRKVISCCPVVRQQSGLRNDQPRRLWFVVLKMGVADDVARLTG
jgi:hypothetical protein